MMQKELNFGSAAIYKIIHEELHMKKVVCFWVPHNLTEYQKRDVSESVKKKSLNLPNDGGHRAISKIVTDDETYMPFYDVQTLQKSKVWVFEDDPMPTMMKSQRAIKKVMYTVLFRSTGLIKAIKLEKQKIVTANWYLQEVNVRMSNA
ncbi:uncharacterized protein TNCV_1035111 [Trichonephila clavipes]|nr:uncharacterized protein TNCV_1035111 [Trichonephila clavipes]